MFRAAHLPPLYDDDCHAALQAWDPKTGSNRGYCSWKYVGCDSAGEVVEMVSSTVR
jgi:hypothetical protein